MITTKHSTAGKLPVMRGVTLSEDDQLRREVITELMCNFRLDKSVFEYKYKIDFDSYFGEALEQLKLLENDGLIELHSHQLKVTDIGRLLIRNIVMNFDYNLMKKQGKKPQFSRTV
jgi:oxygen-independent coproporphyrinogen-3 oxidase